MENTRSNVSTFPPRGGRGIQESQVWEAADALVHEGLRPTIERVRQKIGSGSPNTVSPMLERWFATLGKRLDGRDRLARGRQSLLERHAGLLEGGLTLGQIRFLLGERLALQLELASGRLGLLNLHLVGLAAGSVPEQLCGLGDG